MNVHRNYYQMQLEKHPLAPKEVEVSDRQLSRYRAQVRRGHGSCDFDDHCSYAGEFENGELNGKGVYSFNDGSRYEGEFKNGLMHGQGVYTVAGGHRFEGSYREGKRDGHGVVVYANGIRYDGEVKDSSLKGRGKFFFPNGDVYEGDLEDNLPHGEGTYRFASGTVYEGQFRAGRIHGEGKFEFPEDAGERLESEFEGLRVCAVSVRRSGVSSSWSEYPREAQDPGQLATCCRLARLMSMQGGQIPGQFSNGKFVQPSLVEVEEAVENTDAQDSQADEGEGSLEEATVDSNHPQSAAGDGPPSTAGIDAGDAETASEHNEE
uniref:MORN repeat-containing protein 5 n=1 Tax=Hanusia phi TaxID=3032 RepID=A0A7S0HUR4_9CRYP